MKIILLTILLAATILLNGCVVPQDKYDSLKNQNDELLGRVEFLESQVENDKGIAKSLVEIEAQKEKEMAIIHEKEAAKERERLQNYRDKYREECLESKIEITSIEFVKSSPNGEKCLLKAQESEQLQCLLDISDGMRDILGENFVEECIERRMDML